ncbi:hypothetical protein [Propylenella binzhouense]|uniref:DUF4148 domain-containing protein n=1 Tax=Propylenella binzhouense TaxID=2555902 RepID=A0A964T4J2_9HYPH|nr:hypothetical protein [Propylenella binzhouense]MYZ47382.1 hypothetical protein [Propylenella binzhouense]
MTGLRAAAATMMALACAAPALASDRHERAGAETVASSGPRAAPPGGVTIVAEREVERPRDRNGRSAADILARAGDRDHDAEEIEREDR